MGFFIWIREGVRRAVLMGFSDAISQIGQREHGEELGEQLAVSLRNSAAIESEGKSPGATATLSAPPGRRRLGKSLEQIRNEKAA